MNATHLKLQIEGFQAINTACIELDSVTVLFGPPGSGKTNLLRFTSQLLNSILIFHYVQDYQEQLLALSDKKEEEKSSYEKLKMILKESFSMKTSPSQFQLFQNNQFIAANNQPLLGPLNNINKIYYMVKGRENSSLIPYFWLIRENKNDFSFDLFSDLKGMLEDMIEGEFFLPEDDQKNGHTLLEECCYLYRRRDGKTIPLGKCDAGLKTFLTFYRLLNQGLLDEETLIIFDKPETYLAPSQLDQFVRLAYVLYCRLGVRFLFATDSHEINRTFANISRDYPLGRGFRMYEGRQGRNLYSYDYHQIG